MDFQVKDTTAVQMESLRLFMAALSYSPARANGGFVTDLKLLASRSQLSTRTAIALHNLQEQDWVQIHGKDLFTPAHYTAVAGLFEITSYGLTFLMGMKLVEVVKFMPNKKAPNGITVYEHWVKPANEEIAELFEKWLEDPSTANA